MRSVVGESGLSGIYKGVGSTVLRQSTNMGVRFVVFKDAREYTKRLFPVQMVADFFAGWCAGLASTIVNTPFDVVKTRM